jgi:hypothetical protein
MEHKIHAQKPNLLIVLSSFKRTLGLIQMKASTLLDYLNYRRSLCPLAFHLGPSSWLGGVDLHAGRLPAKPSSPEMSASENDAPMEVAMLGVNLSEDYVGPKQLRYNNSIALLQTKQSKKPNEGVTRTANDLC